MATSVDERPRVQTDEEEPDASLTAAIWVVGVLIGFKVFSLALILAMHLSATSIAMMVWLNLPWVVPLVVLFGGTGFAWYRLWRARLRRKHLLRSEWHVAPKVYHEDKKQRRVS